MQRDYHFDSSDSSVETSDVNIPFQEYDESEREAYDNLGGRQGYQKRVQDFARQSKVMRHEKRYVE